MRSPLSSSSFTVEHISCSTLLLSLYIQISLCYFSWPFPFCFSSSFWLFHLSPRFPAFLPLSRVCLFVIPKSAPFSLQFSSLFLSPFWSPFVVALSQHFPYQLVSLSTFALLSCLFLFPLSLIMSPFCPLNPSLIPYGSFHLHVGVVSSSFVIKRSWLVNLSHSSVSLFSFLIHPSFCLMLAILLLLPLSSLTIVLRLCLSCRLLLTPRFSLFIFCLPVLFHSHCPNMFPCLLSCFDFMKEIKCPKVLSDKFCLQAIASKCLVRVTDCFQGLNGNATFEEKEEQNHVHLVLQSSLNSKTNPRIGT